MSCNDSTPTIRLKRGDTFLASATYTDSDDVPIDLTPITITSQVRDYQDNLLTTMEITKLDQVTDKGKYQIKSPDSYEFPVGKHFCDIQYDSSGVIVSTETIEFQVVKDITQL